jgi:lipopolysaccharide export LptBFGC system permease protein LptF
MSDAGDEIKVDEAPEVEVAAEAAPKGKLSVEDALQVCYYIISHLLLYSLPFSKF